MHPGERTYTVIVVDIRSDLVLLVLMGGILGIDLAIGCYKPVAGKLSSTVNVSDIELQGPHLGELRAVRSNGGDQSIDSLTVTKEYKSSSWRCANPLCKNRSRTPRNAHMVV